MSIEDLKRLEQQKYVPEKYLMHPESYKGLRFADYCYKWSCRPWYRRWFRKKPKYEDIELQVEKEIAEMYKKQWEKAESELFKIRLLEVTSENLKSQKIGLSHYGYKCSKCGALKSLLGRYETTTCDIHDCDGIAYLEYHMTSYGKRTNLRRENCD